MCGVFGAYSPKGNPVLEEVYLGLYALQHRGQESTGVAWIGDDGRIASIKGNGLVHAALDQGDLARRSVHCAIGHVRYSTSGGSDLANAQPLISTTSRGSVAVAHNGNLTNAEGLKTMLESRGAIFQSTTDTEVILHLVAHQPHKRPIDALVDSLTRLVGAYSLTLLIDDTLVAVRDPWGFRPLVIGKRGDVWYVSSETCALDLVGATTIRDIDPGEVVVLGPDGPRSLRIPMETHTHRLCSFEFVYFARPDSVIEGKSVYAVRKELGRRLARKGPATGADIVSGMPDSGTIAAMGFAQESGLSHETAVVGTDTSDGHSSSRRSAFGNWVSASSSTPSRGFSPENRWSSSTIRSSGERRVRG